MTTAIMTTEHFGDISLAEDKCAIISVRFVPPTLPSARKMKGDCDMAAIDLLKEAISQLTAYFEKRLQNFDLPIRYIAPSVFQRKVWNTTRGIPYGETRTYREVAGEIGNVGAVRATGRVLNKNPVALLIPCHRVVTASGELGGYAYGIGVKEALLKLEGVVLENLDKR